MPCRDLVERHRGRGFLQAPLTRAGRLRLSAEGRWRPRFARAVPRRPARCDEASSASADAEVALPDPDDVEGAMRVGRGAAIAGAAPEFGARKPRHNAASACYRPRGAPPLAPAAAPRAVHAAASRAACADDRVVPRARRVLLPTRRARGRTYGSDAPTRRLLRGALPRGARVLRQRDGTDTTRPRGVCRGDLVAAADRGRGEARDFRRASSTRSRSATADPCADAALAALRPEQRCPFARDALVTLVGSRTSSFVRHAFQAASARASLHELDGHISTQFPLDQRPVELHDAIQAHAP